MASEDYVETLIALFWCAFGSGAGMPIEEACVHEGKRRYYENIKQNADVFKNNPAELKRARNCCTRAGHIAAQLAIKEAREEISKANFDAACDEVEERVAKVNERAGVAPMAGVCAALA